eukprot:TRINITY_DN6365_c0_g3_i1.p1 TRINITY_DN6365_c0_g3~~TRINITY_DN6365_c0_g3_i1.p1  ORF type:complete len:344 (-),score=50.20 TRINITY_DN6365_c0_g3_i1:69-1100(-)
MELATRRLQVNPPARLWLAGISALVFLRHGLQSPSAWLSAIHCRHVPQPLSAGSGLHSANPLAAASRAAARSASHRLLRVRSISLTSALAAGGSVAAASCLRKRRRCSVSSSRAASAGDGEAIRLGKDPSPSPAPSSKDSDKKKETKEDKGFFADLMEKWNTDLELREDIQTFFTSLAVALTIRALIVEPRFIPSLSMYPNFDVGDQLTVDKISKNWRAYQRRDVVVFNPPAPFYQFTGNDRSGEALIKRIVALAGDTVEIKQGGKLFVNGEAQEEPFTNEAARYNYGPVKVPEGCVLVLGDNRNQSLDGHIWGFLPVDNIIGRATFKFWPPWHVGTVPASPP